MAASETNIKEIGFHAIWGTHNEDLALLKSLTGHKFQTRKELGDSFLKKGAATTASVKLRPIKMRAYSKLAQALPTDLSRGGLQQVWFKSVFFGEHTTNLGHLFSNYLTKMSTGPSNYAPPTNLFNYYSNYRNSLITKVIKKDSIKLGHVNWSSTEDVSFDKDGSVVAIDYTGVPKLFMSGEASAECAM